MSKDAKLLKKMRRNPTPNDVRFEEVDRLLRNHGWELVGTTGSHHGYRKEGEGRLTMAKPHGKQKHLPEDAIREVLAALRL